MTKIYVKPRAGLLVPDPAVRGGSSEKAMIPPEGKTVDDSTYWRRRARFGDVTIGGEASLAPAMRAAPEVARDGDA